MFEFNPAMRQSLPTYFCCVCSDVAMLKCDKTDKFFCSIECSKEPEGGKNDTAIERKDLIVITCVINERCVYVRNKRLDECKLFSAVFKHSKDAVKLETFPEVGDLVLARHLNDIYRASVLRVLDEDDDYAIQVRLIDFGHTARVLLDDLFVMTPRCQELQRGSRKVFLKDVQVKAINSNLVNFLSDLVLDKTELEVSKIEDDQVVLVDKMKSTNVNQKIAELQVVEDATYDTEGVSLDVSAISL